MKKYYFLSVIGVLLASFYPLKMGTQVICDIIRDGYVLQQNYPKYVIPYTPISIAIIVGVLLMPLIIHIFKKYALLFSSAFSSAIFFVAELIFENMLVATVTETVVTTTIEGWQSFMCISPYISETQTTTETQRVVDFFIGDYSPTFKIHFYIISIVLILAFLNCFYGFYQMIKHKDHRRLKPLILQSVSAVFFLALCIFACFTAFFRTGDIVVSPLSAFLMILFFIVFGITMGIYTGSFLIGRKTIFSVIIPSIVSSIITLVMYIGEMFLLSGHLYRFGQGFFFDGIPHIILAPVDIAVIIASYVLTHIILHFTNKTE
ncbi:MAG: hypothetical protein IJ435_09120 [Clostridia bacterium]|nr:hypothetical protein [Clostridia bacterium]